MARRLFGFLATTFGLLAHWADRFITFFDMPSDIERIFEEVGDRMPAMIALSDIIVIALFLISGLLFAPELKTLYGRLWHAFSSTAIMSHRSTSDIIHWSPTKKPYYDAWAARSDLTLWEAACLWADVQPQQPVPEGRPGVWLSTLQLALAKLQIDSVGRVLSLPTNEQALQGMWLNPEKIPLTTLISRKELLRYARRRKEKPAFLFKRRWWLLWLGSTPR